MLSQTLYDINCFLNELILYYIAMEKVFYDENMSLHIFLLEGLEQSSDFMDLDFLLIL